MVRTQYGSPWIEVANNHQRFLDDLSIRERLDQIKIVVVMAFKHRQQGKILRGQLIDPFSGRQRVFSAT